MEIRKDLITFNPVIFMIINRNLFARLFTQYRITCGQCAYDDVIVAGPVIIIYIYERLMCHAVHLHSGWQIEFTAIMN